MSPQMKYRRKVPGAMNFFSYFELVEGFSHMFFLVFFHFCSVDSKPKRSSLDGDSVSNNLFKVFHFDRKHTM